MTTASTPSRGTTPQKPAPHEPTTDGDPAGLGADAQALLRAYDAELRTDVELADCDEVTRLGPLWLGTFPERGRGFLTYRSLDGVRGAALDDLVDAAIAHYAADERVHRFEWKTRGHDEPADLLGVLRRHGLVPEDPETVMAGRADAVLATDPGLPPGWRLHRAEDAGEVRRAEELAGQVFGDDAATSAAMADELVRRMERDPDSFEMWAVLSPEDEVVCSGRIDFAPGTRFAGLWGGACREQYRGRGLYRALTAARARSALQRGREFLHSDCTEFSRPILERSGLLAITTTTPVLWRRP